MSDSHDSWANLEKAIKIANEKGCEVLLFAGDLIAPSGLQILEKFSGTVNIVFGNNDGEKIRLVRSIDASANLNFFYDIYEETLVGVRIFMNHYPRFVELAAKSGEFDLCVFGHTHTYHHEQIGKTLLVNPGAIQASEVSDTKESSFIIFDCETKKAEKVVLSSY